MSVQREPMSRHGDGSGHDRVGAGMATGAPTFSFAGHTSRPWPKLLSTVTAVGPRINTSGDPESFRKFPDFLLGACPNSPCVSSGVRCDSTELSRFAGKVTHVASSLPRVICRLRIVRSGHSRLGPKGVLRCVRLP